MNRPLSGRESSLLLVLPKGIGDVVYGLALARALRTAHPALRITWAVHPVAAPLLWHSADVERVVTYTPRALSLGRLWRALRSERFDLILNLGMYLHALPPTLLARSDRRIGLAAPYAKDGLPWFHGETVKVNAASRVLDLFAEAGRYLGLAGVEPVWQWQFSESERHASRTFFAGMGRPRVAILPCSGRAEKDWPLEFWLKLLPRLKRAGAFVVVTGGPSRAEREAATRLREADPAVAMAVGDDLRRVLWVLAACDLVIGPDTGPLHMARALNVPLLGLYGHTDPNRYGPYPPFRGTVIDRYHFDQPDTPTMLSGTGGRSDRMRRITAAEVEAASLSLLSEFAAGSRTVEQHSE